MEIRMARLLESKIADYEQLHDEIPAKIEETLRARGCTDMRIYRSGQWLIMLSHFDPALENPDYAPDPELDDWRKKSRACFEIPWEEAEKIYDLNG